mmetsp:Transcript_16727/g.26556  ORF Transcript_16727/g.26556 Transcript_16727/m.26556 type:complete len:239 (+) Transcript_16727:421-1137(+)
MGWFHMEIVRVVESEEFLQSDRTNDDWRRHRELVIPDRHINHRLVARRGRSCQHCHLQHMGRVLVCVLGHWLGHHCAFRQSHQQRGRGRSETHHEDLAVSVHRGERHHLEHVLYFSQRHRQTLHIVGRRDRDFGARSADPIRPVLRRRTGMDCMRCHGRHGAQRRALLGLLGHFMAHVRAWRYLLWGVLAVEQEGEMERHLLDLEGCIDSGDHSVCAHLDHFVDHQLAETSASGQATE